MAARRLTAIEKSFLALERPGLPMHVGGVVVLEPGQPITMADLHRHVRERLRRLPRFRERLSVDPWGLRRGDWMTARRLRLADHLFHHHLARPGTEAQLDAECAAIQERLLDRARPLWAIHLIDGLEGGRQALLVKTHHAITDGIAGIEVAGVLFDPAPEDRATTAVWEPRFADRLAGAPLSGVRALLGLAFTAASGPIARRGPFNGPVGPRRAFATATLSMEAIRQAKRRLGGSVDDVLVAAVAAGLRDYLRELRYPDPPRSLRAMLPVSTRLSGGGSELGNHVTAVFADLPLDIDDFAELVRAVATVKSDLRAVHAATGVGILLEAAGLLPNPVHEAVVRLAGPLTFQNLVLSDVPGPQHGLQLMGRAITGCYPLMPLPATTGLSVAAVSIGGVMGVGITVDPDLVPSPRRLARAVERSIPGFVGVQPSAGRRVVAAAAGFGFRPNSRRVAAHRRTPISYRPRVRPSPTTAITANLGHRPRSHVTTKEATTSTTG